MNLHESESGSVMSSSLRPHGLYSPWNSPGQNTGVSSKPRSPALQADSLPAEPQGKPENTGVGSLSLLQQIFPTQESNQSLLHCRQILYQLSYEGSPMMEKTTKKNMYMHIYITKSLCSTPETNRRGRGQRADLCSPHHVRIYKETPVNQAEGTQQSLIMTLDC